MITIKKGLDLPITGEPSREISEHRPTHVALVGYDYVGMKPTMNVKEGDVVAKGQPVFEDKKRVGVIYTAPAAGKVVAVKRGERRVFESLVIAVDPNGEEVDFERYDSQQLADLDSEVVETQLLASGEWTAFRTRPYSRAPEIGARPHAIFVTAMDTNPLAFDPMLLINEQLQAFNDGLAVLSTLSPKTFVCHHGNAQLTPVAKTATNNVTEYHAFAGKHPAGLAGTHIHFLHPIMRGVTVWTIGYQDVIAIGKLFTTGRLYTRRMLSLAGPAVNQPHLVMTERGADITALTKGKLAAGENRVISGSVLSGRKVFDNIAYLGRFHNQVSVLTEGRERPAFHFFTPGKNRFSKLPIYISQFFGGKKYNFTTTSNGSPRAMVPIGVYEEVMPQDYLPTQLLRALIVEDIISAVDLGVLELDEEDLALCTFVSPGKYEFGDILRDNLTRIELEG
ncbi:MULTISPECIES: Na(+)-translocating NADH-quinone reductase subunit A [Psychrobacter]|jgi:Na+-transporting NADH:ubiquinone oxidoreductase subunit A|uniref:Na(+)-translocating NADH-quinone reductase subunit A n=1 Tax=Psychrobacter namhaensis TaxID=292734 RepID=A0ABW8LAZ9_9GAMM|nr:Na(+)-translocating NADH-quinone reductase subunit A [Psychrobacter sp. CCUG 69069]MCD1280447.1 Na(+)-translocating NADH-quinone reductase subunit A [Psychrobacter sp. CCUG 69069]|tara:strand:- start:748 stop:2100 length:1353 start_codon:yes stop_codon:yes gene_type:complete